MLDTKRWKVRLKVDRVNVLELAISAENFALPELGACSVCSICDTLIERHSLDFHDVEILAHSRRARSVNQQVGVALISKHQPWTIWLPALERMSGRAASPHDHSLKQLLSRLPAKGTLAGTRVTEADVKGTCILN